MVTAYVLIQAEVGKAGQVASAAAAVDGVQQAQPLAGPYDVIVRAEARSIDALGHLAWTHRRPNSWLVGALAGPV
jgi:DNA-binding Lrp family transcriptional regulator